METSSTPSTRLAARAASIVDVFGYASRNPAEAVGFADRGEIAVGRRADLILTDYMMNVKTTFIEGEEQP